VHRYALALAFWLRRIDRTFGLRHQAEVSLGSDPSQNLIIFSLAPRRSPCYSHAMAASRLIDQALALSVTERLKLVADLLESVDGPPPADWEQAWSIEIDRRLNDPTDEVMSWDEVRARLVKKLA